MGVHCNKTSNRDNSGGFPVAVHFERPDQSPKNMRRVTILCDSKTTADTLICEQTLTHLQPTQCWPYCRSGQRSQNDNKASTESWKESTGCERENPNRIQYSSRIKATIRPALRVGRRALVVRERIRTESSTARVSQRQ